MPLRLAKICLEYIALYCSLSLLAIICLSWSVLAIPLYYILPERLGTAIGRCGIMRGFSIYTRSLRLMGAYRLDVSALAALRGGPALLLAANHPSLIDALIILTTHPNIACVLKSELMENLFLGAGSRLARYIRNDSPRQLVKEAVANLHASTASEACIVMIFPEGTRTRTNPVNDLRASVGVIAKHAQIPIQTLLIETDSPFLSKGWSLFRRPALPITYRVRLGQRFDPPQDVPKFMLELENYFRSELADAPQSEWLTASPAARERELAGDE